MDRAAPRRLRVWKQFFRSRPMPELPPSRHYFNVGHTSLNTPDILASLGARELPRSTFLDHVHRAVAATPPIEWTYDENAWHHLGL